MFEQDFISRFRQAVANGNYECAASMSFKNKKGWIVQQIAFVPYKDVELGDAAGTNFGILCVPVCWDAQNSDELPQVEDTVYPVFLEEEE